MALKAETIAQFGGFGNAVPKRSDEYYRSFGFVRSANGVVANKYLYEWYKTISTAYPQYSSIANINFLTESYGRQNSNSGGSNPYLFAMDDNGLIFGSLQGGLDPEIVYNCQVNSSHLGAGGVGGLIGDQNKRLLYAGERYLGMFDPTVTEGTGTGSMTNGGNTITATSGTPFASTDVDKVIRIFVSGGYYYQRLKTYTDSTHMNIYSSFTLPSGTYTFQILRSFTDQWQDFGSNFQYDEDGSYALTPTETYEDTVLFGRGANICTLNTLTDTITDDSSPAFNMPEGFYTTQIHKGANGILIGGNFHHKGILVLWDNFSDRSIAPWIELPDRLVSMCKYNGGWIAITTREIFYTNGYSLTSLVDSFLDSNVTPYSYTKMPQSSVVVENDLYCYLGESFNGTRRNGLHRINLATKLAEYIPRSDGEGADTRLNCLFYGSGNTSGRMYVGNSNSLGYLVYDSAPPVAEYVTNPVGQGENFKHAEAVKVELGMSPTSYIYNSAVGQAAQFEFDITLKISKLDKPYQRYMQLASAMTEYNKIVVDETFWVGANVGEEVMFWGGGNAGYARNVISKTGAGTSAATYTLDRALPNLDTNTTALFFATPFELVKTKSYTGLDRLPEVWFDIKNRLKSKRYMLKIEVENANFPIELRPLLFVYDDTGIF